MGPSDSNRALIDAAKERREIVNKYDRGRDPDAPIDEWEDPAFEIYHTTDRYGFIHDSRLPSERDDVEKTSKEMERAAKWQKMYKGWDKSYKGDNPAKMEKLRTRVWKGIPDKLRGEIWKKLLNIEELKHAQKGVYVKMRDRARTTSPDIRQIDLDVNRTYRNHIFFRERFGVKQTHLFHVLAAYSMYNTEVGYCQGMSQIAALLLMYMDEEEAFWGLSQLLTDKKHAMHGLFIPGFPKLMRYQSHFELVLKKLIPKIYKFMNANMIPPSLYAIKWFMQCFLDRTPFPLTLRLWDIFILDGERILVPMGFTVFKVHKKKLLKMPMETFVSFLQQDLEKDFGLDDDAVIVELEAVRVDLRRSRMDVPPKPTNNDEYPSKPFGCVTYPTEEELIKRQEGQLHINDEPSMDRNSVSVKLRASNVPRTLVPNDSFRSVYDNHPSSPDSEIPIPPVDYNNREPTHDLSPAANSRLSALSAATSDPVSPQPAELKARVVLPAPRAAVVETHMPVEMGSRHSFYRRSSGSAISDLDVVELRLDLPEEDEEEIKPKAQVTPRPRPRALFDSELERPLNEYMESSRSASGSPEIDIDDNTSHMYTRNAGFRSRNMSPRSRQSSTDTEIPVTHISPEADVSPNTVFRFTPPSMLPVRTGEITIPVNHLPPNGTVPFPQTTYYEEPPHFNTGYQVQHSKSPQGASPRPFPVPRSNIPVMNRSNIRSKSQSSEPISSPNMNQVTALHMVSPVNTQLPRTPNMLPSPRRPMATSKSETFQPSPLPRDIRPMGFHTFGGRGRQNPPPSNIITSPSSPGHRSFDNLNSNIRPPRYVSTYNRHHQTLPNTTYYVVSDQNKQPGRGPIRYDFNEDEKSQQPVFL